MSYFNQNSSKAMRESMKFVSALVFILTMFFSVLLATFLAPFLIGLNGCKFAKSCKILAGRDTSWKMEMC